MTVLSLTDVVGYGAALMTLVTFAQKRMQVMRVSAIAANILFIGYGALGPFYPVALLHLVLLPLNLLRLAEHRRGARLSGEPGSLPLIEQWHRALQEPDDRFNQSDAAHT